MARIIVSPSAADALARLRITHSLPADTVERFTRSIRPLGDFPQLGAALEGGGFDGCRFVLGPWRWMVIVYEWNEPKGQVEILTVEDARSSNAASNFRP